jgi:hypothetical protein
MLEALITPLNDREHAQAARHTETLSAAVHQVCVQVVEERSDVDERSDLGDRSDPEL